jgi:PAS domain S-box-containing protein
VLAADELGSGLSLGLAIPLARQLAAGLDGRECCVIDGADLPGTRLAFAVRLLPRTQGGFLGSVVEAADGLGAWLEAEKERLAIQGSLAWEAIHWHAGCARLETQARQLRAEQRTLRASHAQLLVNIVQEHEARLREQEKLTSQLQAVMATAPDGIITVDQRGTILSFNQAAGRIFACDRDQVLGREGIELLVAPAYRQRCRHLFEKLRGRRPGAVLGGIIHLWAIRQTGEEFPAELSVSSLLVEDQWQAVLVIRDITQRKRREEELAAHRMRLEELVAKRTASLARSNARLEQEVAERRQAEKALRQRKALLEAINCVLQEALSC